MASFFSTQTQVALIDTRNNPGTIELPSATTFAYRTILLKDIYGTFATKSLTLTTTGSDTFEDGTTSKVLTTNAGFIQVYAGQAGKWYILSGTDLVQVKVSSLQFSTIIGPLPQLSSVALFTSNTSNYFQNTLQNWSSAVSTATLFTSNTSNYYANALQNWSTPLSTATSFTSNTSNYYANVLQNWSSALSTTSLFTSNTSNYYANLLQNYSTMFSTAVSTATLFTSNTSNYYANTLQNWSTALSTTALFTSNTSNYYANAIQNWSTLLLSTTAGLGNIYLSTATGGIATIPNNLSTMALFTSSASISTTTTIILSTQAIYTSSVQAFVLSSQSLFVSSLYTATRQLTPMFITF
jgi:hypothetical protein